jgi:hypothetical protein
MRLNDHPEPELSESDFAALAAELRAATRRLSRHQILDLADLLHEVIRERQAEERSWRRLQARYQQTEAH